MKKKLEKSVGEFSYITKKYSIALRLVKKHKKFDFSEFNEKVVLLKGALEKIEPIEGYLTPEIENDLNLSTDYFEGQFSELDTLNKKSRINIRVALGILKNLHVAYLWLGNLNKADEKLKMANELRPTLWVEGRAKFLEDRRKRIRAVGL